jgi:hypothetical protein
MYRPSMDAILSRWFTRYDEARRSLEERCGFLFPYRDQYFVSDVEAVRELGLDPEDPDWKRIGWEWVHPRDREAWERLLEKRRRSSR